PAAQLRRCTELEYLLIGDLREMLEEPMTTQGRSWTLAVVETLLETLPREHRLKSVDGYLSEVLTEFPSWTGRVDRLEAQHYDLYDRLTDLRDELEVETLDRTAANSLRYSIKEWMEAFVAHRRNEGDLLQAAIYTDIGGGD